MERTQQDGTDVGQWLSHLFDVLNTPEDRRQKKLDEDLAQFSYVNGDLFDERLPIPAFDSDMRKLLIETCEFSWDAISPAIFGSLFQSVMNARQRRAQGAHYTTEKNILKVIQPLFLDELHKSSQLNLDVAALSQIDVDRFYGIELDEFPVRIAEVALWMMDHIMNNRLSLEFGESYVRIPLRKSPHIVHADALEIDWSDVLPHNQCSYVLGNPPFGGFVFRNEQRQRQMALIARLGAAGGRIDYAAAWYLKAGEYLERSKARVGFVATNSITQGEQVAQIWPALFERYSLEIAFAHRTFAWGSDARGMAHVHVVIIGLTRRDQEPPDKRLFSYSQYGAEPVESVHKALSPYLFDASGLANRHIVVQRARYPLNGLPEICVGSKPVDGGHYIFDPAEREAFLAREPRAEPIMRPFIGGREHINGEMRWILYPEGLPSQELRKLPGLPRSKNTVSVQKETWRGNWLRLQHATT